MLHYMTEIVSRFLNYPLIGFAATFAFFCSFLFSLSFTFLQMHCSQDPAIPLELTFCSAGHTGSVLQKLLLQRTNPTSPSDSDRRKRTESNLADAQALLRSQTLRAKLYFRCFKFFSLVEIIAQYYIPIMTMYKYSDLKKNKRKLRRKQASIQVQSRLNNNKQKKINK